MGFKIKFKIRPAAGSGGDGGAGHASPPPLPPLPLLPQSPSGGTNVPFYSPIPLPPLPWSWPANEDPDEGGEQDDDEDNWDDDEELEEEEEEEDELIKLSKAPCLFMSLRKNTPPYIVRYDSVRLSKNIYLLLHKQWRQLLDGKRTYLRPPRDHHVVNGVFKCPDPRPRALGCQKPILALVHKSAESHFIKQKIKLLSEQYAFVRPSRQDGSSFYRCFLFSYMEKLGQMQDSQAEITRLAECVSITLNKFSILQWEGAYFLNPKEYLSSVAPEFMRLVRTVANSTEDLYKGNLREMMSTRILSLLRLLTEIEIRTREEDYKPFSSQHKYALEFCLERVRPMDVEADMVQIRALSNALAIPLRVEVADSTCQSEVPIVEREYFFPRSESGVSTTSKPAHSSPSTAAQTLQQQRDGGVSMQRAGVSPIGNLLSSDGIPLVNLVYRPGHYDILYLK